MSDVVADLNKVLTVRKRAAAIVGQWHCECRPMCDAADLEHLELMITREFSSDEQGMRDSKESCSE